MNKIFILHIILAILCCANSFAQQRIRILGKVIDEKNDPVGYALISVEGQSAYTMSENDGKYNLICHTDDSVKLVVSLIGYRTKKYTLLSPKDSTIMDLKIISKSNELDVVSVTSTRRQTDQMQHINAQHTKTLAKWTCIFGCTTNSNVLKATIRPSVCCSVPKPAKIWQDTAS